MRERPYYSSPGPFSQPCEQRLPPPLRGSSYIPVIAQNLNFSLKKIVGHLTHSLLIIRHIRCITI
ncbi:hypothetical protein E2C01_080862 [Portunus trituberculatus]|uniref:Uncharacterized protein n=1 Tax=Portunus trituberculatus TaxID=210409 RepID=A0A5B7INC8_PORTR|nr:hypothetical protein [Portunus trituberculatus]